MKLGTVTKLGKRNVAASKKNYDDVMWANCVVNVFFLIYGQSAAIWKPYSGAWSIKLTFSLAITFYLTKTKSRSKNFSHSSHTIVLSKGIIFAKKW